MIVFPARGIIDLLQARASSGRDAFRIVETVFAKIIAKLRRDPRFAGISQFELELLLADISRDAETRLFREMYLRIDLADAVFAIHQCLGEEN
jgi:hypothetical protein